MKYIIISLFFLLIQDAAAQMPGDVLWTKYYGGEGYDEANSVIKANDSGYVFVGTTQSYGLDRWSNAYIGKTNPNGDSLFTFHFGGEGSDVLTEVISTFDNNYIAVGFSDSETDFEQLYIVKFNDNGDTLWTKSYGGAGKEIAFSVIELEDNGLMISGVTSSSGEGNEDVWLLRTDMNGDTLWTKTYGTAGNDMAFGMCRTFDGAFGLTGLYDFSSFLVMKVDTAGNVLWLTSFGGNDFEEGISIIETDNNELLALGHTSSSGAGQLDVYLVRLNSDGLILSEHTYGFAGYDEGRDIIQLNSGEFIIAGNTDVNSSGGELDYYIISVNNSGEINWDKVVTLAGPQRCYALLNNGDGNFVIAGSDLAADVIEDAALTLMAGDTQSDVNDPGQSVNSFKLYDAYPNPFNPYSVISYSIPEGDVVTLKLYDILGKETALLVNEFKNAGTYSVTLNTSDYNLSSGVYFYTIISGIYSSTKKLILMK